MKLPSLCDHLSCLLCCSLGLVGYQMAAREPPFAGLDQETQLHLLKVAFYEV